MTSSQMHARTKARRTVLQALYQWQLTDHDVRDILAQFQDEQDMQKIDFAYFKELLENIPRYVSQLNDYIIPMIDRPLREIDPVELAVLRIGTYELCHRKDIPYRVVINESVELVKRFGAEQSHKYINGVLDKIAQSVRREEINS